MDRLWRVEMSGYILAETRGLANHIAQTQLSQVDGLDISVVETDIIDDSWMDRLPYTENDDDERTCRQILDDIEHEDWRGHMDEPYGPGPFP